MTPVKQKTDHNDDIAIVTLTGSLAFEDVTTVSDEVKALFAEGHVKVLLDMSGITHVNSKGLGALISITAATNVPPYPQYRIWKPSAAITRILTITHLIDVLPIVKDEDFEVARESFGKKMGGEQAKEK